MILALAAIPALVALFLFALVDLERFVLVLILGAVIFPASLAQPAGTNIAAVDIFLVIGVVAWLMRNSLRGARDPWVKHNPMFAPALVFLAVNWLSLGWSIKPKDTIVFSIQLTELIIAFPLIFASIPSSVPRIRKAMTLLLLLTCGDALWAIVTYLANSSAAAAGTYLPGLNKNVLGSFLGAGIVLAFGLMRGRRRTVAVWLTLAGGLDVLGLAASGSRAAMLGAGVGVLAVALLLRHLRLLAFIAASLMLVLYIGVIAPQRATNTVLAGSYTSASVRSIAWSDAIRKIEHDPWLGTGGKTYYDNITSLGIGLPDPDNLFLLTWAELGVPGMVALIFMLYRLWFLVIEARRLPGDAGPLAAIAGGVVVSLLVHFQVDVSWSRGETTLEFVMIGLILALVRLSEPALQGAEAPSNDQPAVIAAEPQLLPVAAVGARTDPSRTGAGLQPQKMRPPLPREL